MRQPGETFGRYEIRGPLGAGGMGDVYRAFDTQLRREVALKLLRVDGGPPDLASRVVREARAAAALTHPNAVMVFDAGEVNGAPFLAMELVRGRTLTTYVGAPLPLATCVSWLTAIASALQAAHDVGLLHRDVKPDNVMITEEGVVKVLDFGIAHRLEADVDRGAETRTQSAAKPIDELVARRRELPRDRSACADVLAPRSGRHQMHARA